MQLNSPCCVLYILFVKQAKYITVDNSKTGCRKQLLSFLGIEFLKRITILTTTFFKIHEELLLHIWGEKTSIEYAKIKTTNNNETLRKPPNGIRLCERSVEKRIHGAFQRRTERRRRSRGRINFQQKIICDAIQINFINIMQTWIALHSLAKTQYRICTDAEHRRISKN